MMEIHHRCFSMKNGGTMSFWERFIEVIIKYGFKILAFSLIMIIGWWLSKYAVKLIERALQKSKVDISIHAFIKSMAGFFFKLLVVITAADALGIKMTTFIAMLSAAGLAVGLALKDSLSNFAAGMLLLVFRPFSVGDYISTSTVEGTVLNIQILYTAMDTVDNKRVMVPNGSIISSHITNYSINEFRRIDRVYSVAYGSDVKKVKEVLMGIVLNDERILDERGIILGVSKHNESSIDFDLKVWVNRVDYFNVLYMINESVLEKFDENHLEIPYPTRDVMVKMVQSDNGLEEFNHEEKTKDTII